MHRRLWLFAGAAIAGLMLVAAAGAMSNVARDSASSQAAPGATLKAAPFAQAWAHVPRTQAARKAKTVLIFGMEQDVAKSRAAGFGAHLTKPVRVQSLEKALESLAKTPASEHQPAR